MHKYLRFNYCWLKIKVVENEERIEHGEFTMKKKRYRVIKMDIHERTNELIFHYLPRAS